MNIQPKRKGKPQGHVEVDYLSSFWSLVVNNKMLALVWNSNKYALWIENVLKANRIIQLYAYNDPQICQSFSVKQIYFWIKAVVALH